MCLCGNCIFSLYVQWFCSSLCCFLQWNSLRSRTVELGSRLPERSNSLGVTAFCLLFNQFSLVMNSPCFYFMLLRKSCNGVKRTYFLILLILCREEIDNSVSHLTYCVLICMFCWGIVTNASSKGITDTGICCDFVPFELYFLSVL